ncbi:MAG: CAP domain-containing protein [Eubacteriales bacterium]|nr:CAP domain-containing protein [Clostridiales bacterium]MDY5836803.1 CAP domain-containing protein [Eubacteriales bacterium]
MKPHSAGEWLLIGLLAVMVVATAVLFITQPFLRDQDEVRLQAIENSSLSSEATEALAMATTGATSPTTPDRAGQNLQALTDRMKLMASYNGDFVQKQVNPILRNLRSGQAEESLPEETLALPGGLAVPDTNSQTWIGQTPPAETQASETQPVYTGPTSPPPLTPQASQAGQVTGETSPPPLDPNRQTQPQQVGETSPPPLPPGASSPAASPAPNPAPGPNTLPGQTSPPPGAPSPQQTSPVPKPGQAGSTVLPGPEVIAQVQGSVVQLINGARAQAGLGQLSNPGIMQTISSQRAGELSVHYHAAPNTHYRPDGSNALVYIANTYGGQYAMGECVAWFDNVGRLSAQLIFDAFMNSPPHRAIIMNAGVGSIGVGVYCVPGPVPDNNTGEPNDSLVGRFFVSLNFGN